MSGMATRQRFALVDTRNGLDIDTFDTFAELAAIVLYQHAIGNRDCLPWPGDMTEAQRCDQLLARINMLAEETRQTVVRNYDPARLRPPEQVAARPPLMLATDKLTEALRELEALGFVVTVGQRPKQPLAMGNYDTVVSVRKARGAS